MTGVFDDRHPMMTSNREEGGTMSETKRRVVGLDLSLTSTGMSDVHSSWVTQTSPEDGDVEGRMDRILCDVRSFVGGYADREASLVVIEAGAFSRGAQSAGAEQLSALRFMVRHWLWSIAVPFAMVTPTGLKSYVAGNGAASKAAMVAAVRDFYGCDFTDVKVKDGRYDLADAFGLAAMGYAHLGTPLTRVGPPAKQQPMRAVKWPQGL